MIYNLLLSVLIISILCNICQLWLPNGRVKLNHVRRAVSENILFNDSVKAVTQSSRENRSKTQVVDVVVVPAGTRKIFIDLGANDGASTSYFLQRSYGGGSIATQGGEVGSFLQGLGATNDWEVVMFEANSNFTKQLNHVRDNALTNGWAKNITVFAGTAISKHSGTISFIIDNAVSGAAGATTMPESTSAVGPHFTIPSVGIADLFNNLRIRPDDFVVVKMDIEGAEFDLLRFMIVHGLHSHIDVLAVEYHDKNYWVFGKEQRIREKYQGLHTCLDWMMEEIQTMKIVKWSR